MRLALEATRSAARVAANGVAFLAPLKPTVPAESQHRVSPLRSVIVTIVLLNVAFTCAIALPMFFLIFFFAMTLSFRFHRFLLPRGQESHDEAGRTRVYLTPFLPATVFLRPLRVRALHLVR